MGERKPDDGHGHSHGLVDDSIKRSREGLRAVGLALLVLGVTAVAQTLVFVARGPTALRRSAGDGENAQEVAACVADVAADPRGTRPRRRSPERLRTLW